MLELVKLQFRIWNSQRLSDWFQVFNRNEIDQVPSLTGEVPMIDRLDSLTGNEDEALLAGLVLLCVI